MDPGGGDVGMPQPLLNLGDIRAVIQHLGCGGGTHYARPLVLTDETAFQTATRSARIYSALLCSRSSLGGVITQGFSEWTELRRMGEIGH